MSPLSRSEKDERLLWKFQIIVCHLHNFKILSVITILAYFLYFSQQEAYLNGTSSSPPQFLHGNKLGSPARYQDLSREMAVLKSQMRELVIIIGNNMFSSSAHVVSV